MLVFEVLSHHFAEIRVGDFLDVGRTACEVIEDIAHLQVMQTEVLFV